MTVRFNPPPNWPPPPPGWTPPPGWQPDPTWPPPPPGWQFWIEDPPPQGSPPAFTQESQQPAPPREPEQRAAPQELRGHGVRLFGARKRAQELEDENASLREQVATLGILDHIELARRRDDLTAQVEAKHQEFNQLVHGIDLAHQRDDLVRQRDELARQRDDLAVQVHAKRQELDLVAQEIVATSDLAVLQEVGVYQYRHPLENAEQYKAAREQVAEQVKAMVRNGAAIEASTSWTVNNSAVQGRAMVRDLSKLMLRAYNAEAENCVRTLRAGNLSVAMKRLEKAVWAIAKLGKIMSIRVAPAYHQLRIQELELVADYQAKVAEEKEAARAERERLREEAKARREYEQEQERLTRELNHYRNALAAVEQGGDTSGADELQTKIDEIERAIEGVQARVANIRAGYVYVISNVGAFGERMVKIGLTRRLDPLDRVYELGDASVPFRFDVHALVFSDDAVGLEARLHQALGQVRVNLVNPRREFFYATPSEVRALLAKHAGHLLDFVDEPEASEWRQSEGERRRFTGPRPGM